jgi:hypothetical protein
MAPPATIGISPATITHAFRDLQPTEAPVPLPIPVQQLIATQELPKYGKRTEGPTQYSETFISGPKTFKADVEIKGSETQPAAKYKHYLPTWDATKSKH